MKKNLLHVTLFLFGAALLWTSCEKKDTHSFNIKGIIIGEAPQEIIMEYIHNDSCVGDTAQIINGKFEFKGTIKEPTIANINLLENGLWIEPGNMELTIDMQKNTHVLKGSKTNDDKKSYYAYVDSLVSILRPYTKDIQRLCDSLVKVKDKDIKKKLEEQVLSLEDEMKDKSENTIDIQKRFIQQHPNSFFSSFLLYPINAGEAIPIDTCIALYNLLSKDVQNGEFGKKIAKDIALISGNRLGESAPLFEAFDTIHNRLIKLDDMKGKVVIMDFWAPWCAPCRWGFKHLKTMYDNYHDKGLEIIAVYTDKKEDKESWEKAIHNDKVEAWHHVKIAENMEPGKENNRDIRSLYYVQAIPRKILIDKNGKIVKIWVGVNDTIEEEVENIVKEKLLE